MGQRFLKDPAATRTYGIDWTRDLDGSQTVASVVWTVPAGITQVATDLQGAVGLIRLSGGTLDTEYTIVGTATLSDGQIDVRRIYIQVANL